MPHMSAGDGDTLPSNSPQRLRRLNLGARLGARLAAPRLLVTPQYKFRPTPLGVTSSADMGVWRSAVISPSEVQSGVPAENGFGAF